MTAGGLGLLAAVAYLRTTSSTGAHVVLGGCCTPLARLLARLPPSTPRQISAIFKIVVGLVQCLSTLRSFSRVLWPEVFTDFIATIDQFTVEVSLVSKRSHTQVSHTGTRSRPFQPKPITCSLWLWYMTTMATVTTATLTMALTMAYYVTY